MNQKQIIINIPNSMEISSENKAKIKKAIKVTSIFLIIFILLLGIGGYRASLQALDYANFNKSEVSRLNFEFDLDDFVPTYDIEWINNYQKYEYTIHAINGKLLKFELD